MTVPTAAFLSHILPADGLRIGCVMIGGRMRQQVFDTTEQLAQFLMDASARGQDAYHACASYRERNGVYDERTKKFKVRCQDNVLSVSSLWADIDTREIKPDAPYADRYEAAAAVAAFCRATGMPPPLFVGSGYGVHVYWPLRDAIPEVVWREYAKLLAQLFEKRGLKVDKSRARDSASILRPPGTHNHKNGGCALVQCGDLVGPYCLADLPLGGSGPQEQLTGTDTLPRPSRSSISEDILAGSDGPLRWSEAEDRRVRSALDCIPATDRDIWLRVGMALRRTGWGERAFLIWDQWSRKATEKYNEADQHTTWESFDRQPTDGRAVVTLGTLFHLAKENGWTDAGTSDEREPNQREKLILIGLKAELWHDGDGNPFATIRESDHLQSCGLSSRAFRSWLTGSYGKRYPVRIGGGLCPSAPTSQALTEAINALAAKAAGGAECRPGVRIGEHGGMLYLDLGTPDWSAVEISASGWCIIQNAPVRFIRPSGLRSLPLPVSGGSLSELREFLNVSSDADFVLVLSWLIACFRANGPYPVLIINGEQGAGKSIACRMLRRLVDPNGAELRSEPKDERDLMLAARNSWIVSLDNLSYVRNDLSDAICRIATGGAFATRALYTNDEEFLLHVCRPVLINGIPPLAARADLSDRAIVCVLPTIADLKRRTEDEVWSAFTNAAPRLLGALLDTVSGAMRMYSSVRLQHSYRMMDFARWAEAAWQGLGCYPGFFEAAYRQNRSSATEDAVDADAVGGAIIDLMNTTARFEGSATELLSKLEGKLPMGPRDRRWPKDATRLSNHLRRLPPLLRPRGIYISFERSADSTRKRLIVIERAHAK
jgi:hypothetical protein